MWSLVLFQNQSYYGLLKFLPLAGGLIVALAQYLPEAISKRLKLTFHLPLGENESLIIMQGFGVAGLLVAFLIFFGLFAAFSAAYFPVQMVADSFITMLPWILAGFSGYFFMSLIVLEPGWIYRFLYALIGVSFISVYFYTTDSAAYGPANSGLIVLTFLLSVVILFSAYRFRKGEV